MKSILKMSVVTLALAGLALTGCTNTTDAPISNDTTPEETIADDSAAADAPVVFECPGGEIITAQFNGTDEAVVTLPNAEPLTLPATEAASGARYSDGTTTLWNKGDEVMVEVNDAVVLSGCTAQN